ncbi:hypothetical protein Nepgr_001238 [Nepenthes gracilis]|uniref:Uncharacterized protein n=1 Tax=Nepenthes gracilis TaxID=150966 RepID=A0AAD3P437_NEPGR|nr:hypothetical protein Nepgr_001238 [Nepenthes gracilis]
MTTTKKEQAGKLLEVQPSAQVPKERSNRRTPGSELILLLLVVLHTKFSCRWSLIVDRSLTRISSVRGFNKL